MICLDVRDRRDGGRQREEGAVVFVGFDDEQLVAAAAQIPSPRGHASADDAGRVPPGGGERLGGHDGGRRLSVRAGDADRLPCLDRSRERLGAANHRDAELARASELGVVARHGRGRDDGLRARSRAQDRGAARRRCRAARVLRCALGLASHPVTAIPRRANSSASALIPAPAMPTKWTGRGSCASKSVMRRSQYSANGSARSSVNRLELSLS